MDKKAHLTPVGVTSFIYLAHYEVISKYVKFSQSAQLRCPKWDISTVTGPVGMFRCVPTPCQRSTFTFVSAA